MLVKQAKEYVGKYVKVVLFDGNVLIGKLGHNTRELPKNRFYIDKGDRYCFRASHIRKIESEKQ